MKESVRTLIEIQAPSQERNSLFWLQMYEKDLKVKRPAFTKPVSRGDRQKIFSFSPSSQRNLLHVCRNSGHHVVSQFVCSYHETWPLSGVAIKSDMATFIKRLRRRFKDIHFIWCLEFQKRGAPHFHFFSDIEPTLENRLFFATSWVEVIDGGASCLKFHSHSSNFIPWNMKSGAYLAKEYIGKVEQKNVPENFQDVGRFWGSSRNMKPKSSFLFLDLQTPETVQAVKRSLRIVTKHHEKKVCGLKRALAAIRRERNREPGKPSPIKKKNLRNCSRSITLHSLTPAFLGLLSAAYAASGILPTFC